VERNELAAWLRLALTPSIGNIGARRLLAAFGLPPQIFAQPTAALTSVVGAAGAAVLGAEPDGYAQQLEQTLAWMAQSGARAGRHILTLADAAYPAGLLHTEDPPLMLYALGQLPATWPRAVAVVGSRNPTAQGRANAQAFARSFAQAGLTVVSGLALGVDGAAHTGALEGAAPGQLATIAVVGTGLDRVYPKQHLDLAHRIAAHGLLLSEYPLGTPPLGPNFPRRNRIISALGQGTLVVEAALQSGSLITARLALEQGRDVFAIPGSIHSVQSRGCHALLKQGAKLVETAQDVLEELGCAPQPVVSSGQQAVQPALHEGALLQALAFEPTGLDALVDRTGMTPADLQAQLLELELAGEVARLPGGLFQRMGSA
jgi:DNA processing protein